MNRMAWILALVGVAWVSGWAQSPRFPAPYDQ